MPAIVASVKEHESPPHLSTSHEPVFITSPLKEGEFLALSVRKDWHAQCSDSRPNHAWRCTLMSSQAPAAAKWQLQPCRTQRAATREAH